MGKKGIVRQTPSLLLDSTPIFWFSGQSFDNVQLSECLSDECQPAYLTWFEVLTVCFFGQYQPPAKMPFKTTS